MAGSTNEFFATRILPTSGKKKPRNSLHPFQRVQNSVFRDMRSPKLTGSAVTPK